MWRFLCFHSLDTHFDPHFVSIQDVIHQICSPQGKVLRVVIFKKNGVQAMVEFDSVDSARRAKLNLHGCDIYSGCCTLRIEYAKVCISFLPLLLLLLLPPFNHLSHSRQDWMSTRMTTKVSTSPILDLEHSVSIALKILHWKSLKISPWKKDHFDEV